MSTSILISEEIQKLAPSAIIELFEIDTTVLGGDIYYLHAGTNELTANITWNSQIYTRFPLEASGFNFVANAQIPRPILRVSNLFGTITALILANDDLIGSKVTRRRTLLKFLDAVNFTGGVNASADPTAEFEPDIYYIDRKANENKNFIEFELASSIDLEGVRIPFRQIIQNVCPWGYRSAECSYTGLNYFDKNDNLVATAGEDTCSKKLSGCKARFGENSPLPFGAFPSASLIK